MSTLTAPTVTPGLANRIGAVVRLHFVNAARVVVYPWLIMLAIIGMNLAIWALILGSTSPTDQADVRAGLSYSGSSTFIFIYMMVVAVQAISATFPFALGFSVTRRDYYLGTVVTFMIISVVYGGILTLLAMLEDATHGWGLGGRMFTTVYFDGGNWLERWFMFSAALLFFLFIGCLFASVWVRWKTLGLITALAVLAFALIGIAALVSVTTSWGAVGQWFTTTGLVGIYAWALAVAAVAAIAGFFILRRATPTN